MPQKYEKKLMNNNWEKCWTVGQIDRQTDNNDLIGPSSRCGSNY